MAGSKRVLSKETPQKQRSKRKAILQQDFLSEHLYIQPGVLWWITVVVDASSLELVHDCLTRACEGNGPFSIANLKNRQKLSKKCMLASNSMFSTSMFSTPALCFGGSKLMMYGWEVGPSGTCDRLFVGSEGLVCEKQWKIERETRERFHGLWEFQILGCNCPPYVLFQSWSKAAEVIVLTMMLGVVEFTDRLILLIGLTWYLSPRTLNNCNSSD